MDLRRRVVDQLEALTGTHDEPHIYGGEPGDPGLTGPGSMSWEIHSDMGAIAAAGLGSVIMEVLHPLVMAGVHDLSSYQTQPLKRASNTMGYVLRTTFGSTEAATSVIERVRRMHERVNGVAPDGRQYRAMDPELIAWVHTAIPWGIMTAYDRYHRPLTVEEKDRYLAEQAVIGRMGGAEEVPETVADLDAYVEEMRPHLAVNHQTRNFIDFLVGEVGPEPVGTVDRFNRKLVLQASMSLMPRWARQLAGLDAPELARTLYFEPANRLNVRMVRWAFGTPACRRLAEARVTGTAAVAEAAA